MTARSSLIFALTVLCPAAGAVPVTWTDWTSADATTAEGTAGAVMVSFEGPQNPASQTDEAGTNYWATNPEIYRGGGLDNGPEPSTDIIRISDAASYRVAFSEAVVNPVMALLSVGRSGLPVSYDFDQPFDVINSGAGFFGGNAAGSLFEDPGDVMRGVEGHGVIQFIGTFDEISWTTDPSEVWHGLQIGLIGRGPVGVAEPAVVLLFGLGLLGIALARRR